MSIHTTVLCVTLLTLVGGCARADEAIAPAPVASVQLDAAVSRTGRGRSAVPDGVFVVPRGRRDKERGRVHGWLGKAARQSHTEAKYRHGGMLSEKATTPAQIEEATSWLESAAAQGNDNASLLLAKWLRAAGPQQDLVRGAKWLRYRVEHGDAGAQLDLVQALQKGEGMPADSTQSLRWYMKSAEVGEVQAQLYLAREMLADARPAAIVAEGRRWLDAAIAQDSVEGMLLLGALMLHGRDGVPVDNAQSLAWIHRAAENWYAPAMNELGHAFRDGAHGLDVDPTAAAARYS